MESELSEERGLWGPMEASSLDKWMLDSTESGPCRMRKRTLKNKLFYQHYPYIEQQPNQQLKYKVSRPPRTLAGYPYGLASAVD